MRRLFQHILSILCINISLCSSVFICVGLRSDWAIFSFQRMLILNASAAPNNYIFIHPTIFSIPTSCWVLFCTAVEGIQPPTQWSCILTPGNAGDVRWHPRICITGGDPPCQALFTPLLGQREHCSWCWWSLLAWSEHEAGCRMIYCNVLYM